MLIKNELFKIFKKKKIYVFIIMVVVVLLFHALLIAKGMANIGDWIPLIKTQLAATGFIIFVMVLMFSADVFSEDYSLGTVKMLFVRPQKRVLILLSKLAAIFTISVFLLLIVFVLSFLINTFIFDAPLLNKYIPYVADSGETIQKSYIVYIIQIFLATLVQISIYIFMASMLAIIFKHSSVAIIICLVAHFIASPILDLLSFLFKNTKMLSYVLFYNTDLSQYINNGSNSWGTSIWFSIAVLSAYVALFLFVSYKMYCKRDVY